MAIAGSLSLKITPASEDRLSYLTFYAVVAGDASGGDIEYDLSLDKILQPEDKLYFDFAQVKQDNAVTDDTILGIYSGYFDNLRVATVGNQFWLPLLIASDTGIAGWSTYSTNFYTNKHARVFPDGNIYLGKPIVMPTLSWWHTPNTNAKNYSFISRFILEKPPKLGRV